jgi:1-phosphofructokinase family hexose kinase
MVLTVTLNPLLERRYSFNKIKFNAENRLGKKILRAGGKGINVSRQLNKLGIENIALTFTGGVNGKLFKEILRNDGISFADIQTKEETRDAAIVIESSNNQLSTFFSENISISEAEANTFITKMEKMIATCEIVVFAGSSPCKTTDSIITKGIEIASKLDKISICDTYGSHLQKCIHASPSIIHNNVEEIESSLNTTLKTKSDKLSILNEFYSKGIKQAFITDGSKPFYSSNFDFHYKVTVPKIEVADSTGSGDSFVAGVAYGWHNKLTFEEQLAFATALAVKNAETFSTSSVGKYRTKSIFNLIGIDPVGKKLKLINDKPD